MTQENYRKNKADFLDSLQPDDFRNGGNFNQIEEIIDELKKAAMGKKNPQEFVKKAASHLFRENSLMVEKLVDLLVSECR